MSAHRPLPGYLAGITLAAGLLLASCGSAATPATTSGSGHPAASPGTHKAAAHRAKALRRHVKRVRGTVTATTSTTITVAPSRGSPVTVTVTPHTRVRLAPSGSKTKPKITTLLAVTKGARVTVHAVATPNVLRAVLITVA